MLVNEVINSKSIALAATSNASASIPFLGKQWFPEQSKAGIDLKWIKTHKNLPISLAPSNFDALPTLRARGGIDIAKTQMAFFREQMIVDETTALEIDRIKEANDPYLTTALNGLYDDTNTLVEGAEVVAERMRMQLLATTNGHPMIGISANGVNYAYDYDPDGTYASTHYVKNQGNAVWSDKVNSKPITDLITAKKKLTKKGKVVKYALMNSVTFGYLLESEQVRNSILAQNVVATIDVTDENVKSIIKARTGLQIVIYDKYYQDEQGNEYPFYPDNKVTLLPEINLGKTWFGDTPESRTARQVSDVDVSIYGAGIAVAVKTEYGPPALTSVTCSEVVLPSYENMDSTFVIEVA